MTFFKKKPSSTFNARPNFLTRFKNGLQTRDQKKKSCVSDTENAQNIA